MTWLSMLVRRGRKADKQEECQIRAEFEEEKAVFEGKTAGEDLLKLC